MSLVRSTVVAGAVAMYAATAVYPSVSRADGNGIGGPVQTCTIDFGEGRRFELELATTQEQRVRGLSGRTDEVGMAFVWPIPGRREFWMVGTPLPLRLLWIDADGTVAGTVNTEPMSETVHRSPERLRMAIELPSRWMKTRPVEQGERIEATDCGPY